ncbi:guanine nucleotide binding protein, alpha subunit [Hygrophoropsis aurantiaca]|uniref:Guanine nucleotide binding protein, alpha subunit n=1 Tax=Hygrophoropsis aurantiaca TaxID=72124 RepID=A0ACB8A1J6_9AGAM|nr:guanine nucleotide binding protein, alpha subunit [Hygrophoropsis aurantiaca]
MGNWVSSRAAKRRSDKIDHYIGDDSRKFRKDIKILLLGSSESGKSTIVKQMRIIHQNGFSRNELMSYRSTIFKNTVDSAQAIVYAMRKIGVDCVHPANRTNVERILDCQIDATDGCLFTAEIAQAIHELWQDPVIPKVLIHCSEFYLMDNAAYFFAEVLRIGAPAYVPTENDVLRALQKTTGITETRFNMGQLSVHMFDVGGQQSERKNWIHCFESVTSVIFCAALSEYDQVLLEEQKQNRMAESILLFESIINSQWFLQCPIILFLTKIDIFEAKLPNRPLEQYFPEYTGGADVNKATEYILWRFMQANRARLSIYPHLPQLTDTSNVRLIFTTVKETIIQNALKGSGIL